MVWFLIFITNKQWGIIEISATLLVWLCDVITHLALIMHASMIVIKWAGDNFQFKLEILNIWFFSEEFFY